MSKLFSIILVLVVLSLFLNLSYSQTNDSKTVEKDKAGKPSIALAEDVKTTVKEEVSEVGEQLHTKAQSLFTHTPPGWSQDTIKSILGWFKDLPFKFPVFLRFAVEQSRILGFVGSLIILAFLFSIIYSLIISKRLLTKIEEYLQPLKQKLPEAWFPYLLSASRILIASLFPFFLLLTFLLIKAIIVFKATWFLLIGDLLLIWIIGALIYSFLWEFLVGDLAKITTHYGKSIFGVTRLVLLYLLISIAILTSAEAFRLPKDILAFTKFVISFTIVCSFLLLLRRKKALLAMLPDIPYKSYKIFVEKLNKYYFTAIFLTFIVGLMWCFGYKRFASVVILKTWAVAGVFIFIMVIYHYLGKGIVKWSEKAKQIEEEDEDRIVFFKSLKSLLNLSMVTSLSLITLYLFGLLESIKKLLSFTILTVGESHLSIWSFLIVTFIIVSFSYFSHILRAILDYKFFPFFKIDTGLAYAINTFLTYAMIAVGILSAFIYIGFDLRVLMVFAGAIGIGIGFGLQKFAANLLSGFIVLFGQRLRKDDWIQVGDATGVVTQISLRATKVKTRDNIEYIIPNEEFISNTFVNYTLSSPMIRITLPVGVSYNADPQKVKELLIKAAEKHPEASHYRKPDVYFKDYGDSAINFELLVWFDIRKISDRMMSSRLYFTIFEDLKAEGIEIPFPQRDIHIRSRFSKEKE
ncbi:mechanosensitive ion channel [bacterium]|nr:mechanosensitive ion channel [bacterium]